MSSFIARLARDEDGGPLVEVAIILPILILFLFGGVDFMNALYQWNAAAKAVEIGARIAAVSDPIASGLTSIADNAVSSGVASGSPMPDFTVECDGGASACSCTSGACDGMGAYSAEAMGFHRLRARRKQQLHAAGLSIFRRDVQPPSCDRAAICDGGL